MNPSEWPRSVAPSLENPPGYSVGIVIPVKNGLKFFKLCFHSLLAFADHPHTITVVDNQSNLKAKDYFRITQKNHPLTVLRYDDDFNFAAEVNLGLRHAFKAPSVQFGMVLQADVVLTPEFLSGLVQPFAENDQLGVSGPMVRHVWPDEHPPLTPLNAGCLIFRRRVFEEVGGFDEGFKGAGYEDQDFCVRSAAAGWHVLPNERVVIHHGPAGFWRGEQRAVQARANRERFLLKHSLALARA